MVPKTSSEDVVVSASMVRISLVAASCSRVSRSSSARCGGPAGVVNGGLPRRVGTSARGPLHHCPIASVHPRLPPRLPPLTHRLTHRLAARRDASAEPRESGRAGTAVARGEDRERVGVGVPPADVLVHPPPAVLVPRLG